MPVRKLKVHSLFVALAIDAELPPARVRRQVIKLLNDAGFPAIVSSVSPPIATAASVITRGNLRKVRVPA